MVQEYILEELDNWIKKNRLWDKDTQEDFKDRILRKIATRLVSETISDLWED